MKHLLAFAFLVALAGAASAADSDIRQQQRQFQSEYDAAHPGDHKGCVTAFFARSGEFVGFRTVPDGDQFVARSNREIATCRNGRQIVSTPGGKPLAGNQIRRRGAASGRDQRIDYFYALYSDCRSQGYPTITIIRQPENGAITSTEGEANPVYAKDNERAVCNLKPAPVTLLHYESKPGYRGGDRATIEVLFPLGSFRTIDYVFDVK